MLVVMGWGVLTMMASACLESNSDTALRKPLAEEVEELGVGILAVVLALLSALPLLARLL